VSRPAGVKATGLRADPATVTRQVRVGRGSSVA